MSVEIPEHIPVVDRYYTKRYAINLRGKACEDMCILSHSNKISIVTIAEGHPIIMGGKTICQVDFQNRMENKVTGKGKRGAQSLTPTSALCTVTCTDESKYILSCGIKGQLIEVNDTLVHKPQLLVTRPQAEGYIAVVLSKLNNYEKEMATLLPADKYMEVVDQRKQIK